MSCQAPGDLFRRTGGIQLNNRRQPRDCLQMLTQNQGKRVSLMDPHGHQIGQSRLQTCENIPIPDLECCWFFASFPNINKSTNRKHGIELERCVINKDLPTLLEV